MAKYILALDQGTTSSRSIVFNHDGAIVSVAQQEFPQIYPAPGLVEHDPEAIWSSQLTVAREALQKAGASASDIAAIGITNQRETAIVWEKSTGKPVFNRSEEHTSELQSLRHLVCRLLLEKKKKKK